MIPIIDQLILNALCEQHLASIDELNLFLEILSNLTN